MALTGQTGTLTACYNWKQMSWTTAASCCEWHAGVHFLWIWPLL